jgi:hypothetical protein
LQKVQEEHRRLLDVSGKIEQRKTKINELRTQVNEVHLKIREKKIRNQMQEKQI